VKRLWLLWDEFWFSERNLLNLAVFRVVLCGTMFLMYLNRQFDLENFYSEKGLLPFRAAFAVMPEFYRPPFTWYFWGDSWMVVAHLVLVAGLFLLTLGIGGRVLNLVVWICHIAFLQRNYSVAFGADLIGGIFLFLMIGTQSCARLTALSFFRRKPKDVSSDLLTSVFSRMIQVQLCVIYAYTGFEKLKGMSWWDGTALWTVFANPQMVIVDLGWTRHFPLFIVGATFGTLLFEIYFPALVWGRRTRPWVLLAGVCFHLGIGVSMALMNFALIMLAPYALFADLKNLPLHKFPRLSRRTSA
jgi:hypothetical protein